MSLATPLVVTVVGLLMFAFASNGKMSRAGEIAYAVGLLWLVYLLSGSHVHF